ncbi:MRNIP protein, partial [Penelope pileata]|nr:MRNIP protein [Penelope pileata]
RCAISAFLLQLYGQGSGRDCRRHVQRLNLLQGQAEAAAARSTLNISFRCTEESVNDNKNTAVHHEDSSVLQEGRAEVSRWSKYLDKGSEDQEEEEEEGSTERQQFCSRWKNAVEEQRKQQKSFPYSDVQEYSEENEAFQLAYQAKKFKKCSAAAPDQDDGDAVCAASAAPQGNKQTSNASTKPSKWEKYLSCSGSCSGSAAVVTLPPQDGSGRLGLHSTTAVSMATRCSEQAQSAVSPSTDSGFNKCIASTEQRALKLPASMLPSISSSNEEDALVKDPQLQPIATGFGGFDMGTSPPAPTLVNSSTRPKPQTISCDHLFCTGEEFDDDF